MTVKEAEEKLNNMYTQLLAGLCSQQEINTYINLIDIVWRYSTFAKRDDEGRMKGYEVYERHWD